MTTGKHSGFHWLESEQLSLKELLSHVPQIALRHYLVNTSFDSGSLAPTAEQLQQGWRAEGPITYSPVITDINAIPHELFEEWLVFPEPTHVTGWEPVIDYRGFSLTDRSYDWIQAKLWSDLERYRPESFLAQGDLLIFITRNPQLHALVHG